jgi:hypothetical protein
MLIAIAVSIVSTTVALPNSHSSSSETKEVLIKRGCLNGNPFCGVRATFYFPLISSKTNWSLRPNKKCNGLSCKIAGINYDWSSGKVSKADCSERRVSN